MADEIITGLDIGSHTIRVAVGQMVPADQEKDQMHIIGAVEVPAEGVSKGTISSRPNSTAISPTRQSEPSARGDIIANLLAGYR